MILAVEDAEVTVLNQEPELLPTSSTITTDSSKQWAKRRRRPTSLVHLRNDAAAKISDVADCQQSYYTAKLEMAREKHALEMSVLNLHQQLLTKQLAKVTEE